MAMVILSAAGESFSVSRMEDYFYIGKLSLVTANIQIFSLSHNWPLCHLSLYVSMSMWCMLSPTGNQAARWTGDLWLKSIWVILARRWFFLLRFS